MALERERGFWDRQARGVAVPALVREAAFVESDPLWRWALERVAGARPERVLDLGCGRGATSVMLARHAHVVGLDASLESLAAAARLAAGRAVRLDHAAGSIEALPFADASFDLVAGRFVLHHAESLEAAAREIERVLRPGGSAVFVETWGRNPLLRFGRELAGLLGIGFGTADERPLEADALALLGRYFRVDAHFPVFTAFELANRLLRRAKPLAARSPSSLRALGRTWSAAIAADRWVERKLPALRPWGWFVGLVLERR